MPHLLGVLLHGLGSFCWAASHCRVHFSDCCCCYEYGWDFCCWPLHSSHVHHGPKKAFVISENFWEKWVDCWFSYFHMLFGDLQPCRFDLWKTCFCQPSLWLKVSITISGQNYHSYRICTCTWPSNWMADQLSLSMAEKYPLPIPNCSDPVVNIYKQYGWVLPISAPLGLLVWWEICESISLVHPESCYILTSLCRPPHWQMGPSNPHNFQAA